MFKKLIKRWKDYRAKDPFSKEHARRTFYRNNFLIYICKLGLCPPWVESKTIPGLRTGVGVDCMPWRKREKVELGWKYESK